MKIAKICLLLLMLFATMPVLQAQELEVNEYDEFTNTRKKITSWIIIAIVNRFGGYAQFSSINDVKYFGLKMILGAPGKVFSIEKGDLLMLKLEDGTIIKLACPQFTVTCNGCGARGMGYSDAQGIYVRYPMTEEDYQSLLKSRIVKIRVYITEGYAEEEVNEKYSQKLWESVKLLE